MASGCLSHFLKLHGRGRVDRCVFGRLGYRARVAIGACALYRAHFQVARRGMPWRLLMLSKNTGSKFGLEEAVQRGFAVAPVLRVVYEP